MMDGDKKDGELETCPICPAAGPPVPPKPAADSTEKRADDDEELQWIACSKCKKWFHTACTVLVPEFKEATIPAEVRQELDASGQGEWFDWADRIDRW